MATDGMLNLYIAGSLLPKILLESQAVKENPNLWKQLKAWIYIVNQEITDKAALSLQFVFKHNKTLVSFTPKKGKTVMLPSTVHVDKAVSEQVKKPEIIHFYNLTKGGVDSFDEIYTIYSE
jgi:hypothetical protein